MTVVNKPLAELTEEAIRILYRELGMVDTVRSQRQFSTNLGDYTADRAERGDEESLDELIAKIHERRTAS